MHATAFSVCKVSPSRYFYNLNLTSATIIIIQFYDYDLNTYLYVHTYIPTYPHVCSARGRWRRLASSWPYPYTSTLRPTRHQRPSTYLPSCITTEIQTLVPLSLSTFMHYNGDSNVSTAILIYLHALQRRFKR